MLFKERLFLSNCDSVKILSDDELRKRVLIGLTFGNGVIFSPNILLENESVVNVLSQRNVIKFLNEEGLGHLVIRGFNLQNIMSMSEYFDCLPSTYKISSLGGISKKDLTPSMYRAIRDRFNRLDRVLFQVNPIYENAQIESKSLTQEVNKRITSQYFNDNVHFKLFIEYGEKLRSRSEWYAHIASFSLSEIQKKTIKTEIIDPAYNSLFINKSEAFFQDNINILEKVPEIILDGGVLFKSLRREIELIQYPIKAFEWITSLGATDLIKLVTDEAISYIEDKILEKADSQFTRKNWFGLYPKLTHKIGLEIK